MKKLLIIFALVLAGCSSHNDATKALTAAGFTNIETNGVAFFSCSEDDAFKTKFTATNPQGQRVSGVVCSGWFKGATIRF